MSSTLGSASPSMEDVMAALSGSKPIADEGDDTQESDYFGKLEEVATAESEKAVIRVLDSVVWAQGDRMVGAENADELKRTLVAEARSLVGSTGHNGAELFLAGVSIGNSLRMLHPDVMDNLLSNVLLAENLALAAQSADRIAAGEKANTEAVERYLAASKLDGDA